MKAKDETAGAGTTLHPPRKPHYRDSLVTLYCGDAAEIMSELRPSVMITDPPYGVSLGKHGGAKEKRANMLRKSGYDIYDDTPENFKETVIPILTKGIEMTKRSAIFGLIHSLWDLPKPTWLGGVFIPAGCGRGCWGFQNLAPVLFYGCAPNMNLGCKPTAMSSSDSALKNGHPCPKPLRWMTWLVGLCATKEDIVFDPFAGSGTTLRAAKDLGIKSIGIELSEAYCEIAVRNLSQESFNL